MDLCEGSIFKIEQVAVVVDSDCKIEHTEHVGGLFSSVWGQGGPGIRGGIIWSFRASKVPVELQESWDFYHVYIDVFDVLDVVRCACGLFVRGPGKQHQPRRASTPSCGTIPAGREGLEQGRSLFANTCALSWFKQSLAGY